MKLIILDRDGVINEDSDQFIKSADEWIPIEGSLQAISRLNRAGFQVVVITNQSGIGRGLFSIEDLNTIHEKMHNQLSMLGGHIESILFCPHHPDHQCECRKPKPGLFIDLKNRLGMSLEGIYAVGDSLRDLQAAQEVGARPILVRSGKGEKTIHNSIGLENIPVYNNLSEFSHALLSNTSEF